MDVFSEKFAICKPRKKSSGETNCHFKIHDNFLVNNGLVLKSLGPWNKHWVLGARLPQICILPLLLSDICYGPLCSLAPHSAWSLCYSSTIFRHLICHQPLKTCVGTAGEDWRQVGILTWSFWQKLKQPPMWHWISGVLNLSILMWVQSVPPCIGSQLWESLIFSEFRQCAL